MAKANPVSAKATAKRLRRAGAPTFIQRSREVASEQKAIWHNVTGAGRSGVIREFFDLSQAELGTLRDGLEQVVALRTGARSS